MADFAITADGVTFAYGARFALQDVSFQVPRSCVFGLLGPNGSGKTTLFRLLSTLIPLQRGSVHVLGMDLAKDQSRIRRQIGVTFQSPAVDVRLTVEENLSCHAALFGQTGSGQRSRIDELLKQFDLLDRRRTIVGELSGGLKRRVELAKGLFHSPSLLLLDEPTTGLDPRARQDFWTLLREHCRQHGTTVVVTTHLMPEAEFCQQLMLLDRGRRIAEGATTELQRQITGERLTVRLRDPDFSREQVEQLLQSRGTLSGDRLSFRVTDAAQRVSMILEQCRDQILSLELTHPSLEDVFMELTGRAFETAEVST